MRRKQGLLRRVIATAEENGMETDEIFSIGPLVAYAPS